MASIECMPGTQEWGDIMVGHPKSYRIVVDFCHASAVCSALTRIFGELYLYLNILHDSLGLWGGLIRARRI